MAAVLTLLFYTFHSLSYPLVPSSGDSVLRDLFDNGPTTEDYAMMLERPIARQTVLEPRHANPEGGMWTRRRALFIAVGALSTGFLALVIQVSIAYHKYKKMCKKRAEEDAKVEAEIEAEEADLERGDRLSRLTTQDDAHSIIAPARAAVPTSPRSKITFAESGEHGHGAPHNAAIDRVKKHVVASSGASAASRASRASVRSDGSYLALGGI